MESFTLKIRHLNDINVSGILKRVPKEHNVVVIQGPQRSLVCVRAEIVAESKQNDGLRLGDYPLFNLWHTTRNAYIGALVDGTPLFNSHEDNWRDIPDDWRAFAIHNDHLALLPAQVQEISRRLVRDKVKVYYASEKKGLAYEYCFYIGKSDVVNITRVLVETPHEIPFIVIDRASSHNILIMARKTFVNKFKSDYGRSVASDALHPRWGESYVYVRPGNVARGFTYTDVGYPDAKRVNFNFWRSNLVTRTMLSVLKIEARMALSYSSLIEMTVRYL